GRPRLDPPRRGRPVRPGIGRPRARHRPLDLSPRPRYRRGPARAERAHPGGDAAGRGLYRQLGRGSGLLRGLQRSRHHPRRPV
ncbi:MAG: hypothetical protein AVDCRST_MAG27-2715, partial [uncultured Craurococcus sp.]